MSLSTKDLQSILDAQQIQTKELISSNQNISMKGSTLMESLANSISEFAFEPEAGCTFETWFKRYKDVFIIDAASLDDAARVRLILRRLHTSFPFVETVNTLKKLFGEQSWLFNIRYNCLIITKKLHDDYTTHAGIINKECERFQLAKLTEDQFKCLIFVCSLQDPSVADIRLKLLHKIETEAQVSLQILSESCNRLINFKNDTKMIESTKLVVINTVKEQHERNSDHHNPRKANQIDKTRLPPSPCWNYREVTIFSVSQKSRCLFLDITIREVPCRVIRTNYNPDQIRQQYPRICSQSLGHCTLLKAHLQLKEHSKPVFRARRTVPYAAQHAVDKTLNGGKIISQIDFADAYLQVEVEDESKELLTINTHRGPYRYNRHPFRVKSTSGIFQQIMDIMPAGTQRAIMILSSQEKTITELQRNLDAVLRRIEEFGFKIRLDKCSFALSEVKYLGFTIDKNGRRPYPVKIEAIRNMPPPIEINSLRSFLGLVNYYSSFVKNMNDYRGSLDNLLKKDVIEYRSTTSFGQADALSRLIVDRTQQLEKEDHVNATISTDKEIRLSFQDSVRALPVTTQN
uniref:Reverse transcriptase domain-containing protein n=1 Tax=Heterorhabditis bacteriophora TaxID=37862 RepID=A0A1I7XDM4_HETBA